MLSILLALPSKAAKGWYYDEHEDPKPGDPFAADGQVPMLCRRLLFCVAYRCFYAVSEELAKTEDAIIQLETSFHNNFDRLCGRERQRKRGEKKD